MKQKMRERVCIINNSVIATCILKLVIVYCCVVRLCVASITYPPPPSTVSVDNFSHSFYSTYLYYEVVIAQTVLQVQVHGDDFESLFDYVPADNLPLEYSGALASVDDYCAVNLFEDELASNEQSEQ